jgi:hypothetical protein
VWVVAASGSVASFTEVATELGSDLGVLDDVITWQRCGPFRLATKALPLTLQ